jgi:hypothetical protein
LIRNGAQFRDEIYHIRVFAFVKGFYMHGLRDMSEKFADLPSDFFAKNCHLISPICSIDSADETNSDIFRN